MKHTQDMIASIAAMATERNDIKARVKIIAADIKTARRNNKVESVRQFAQNLSSSRDTGA